MPAKTPLERAIDTAGGVGALAAALRLAPSIPSMWKKRGRVPAEYCPAIEQVTRDRALTLDQVVTCEEMRPDVAWDVLRHKVAARAEKFGPHPLFDRRRSDRDAPIAGKD